MIFLNNAATTQQKPDSVKAASPATEAEARSQAARLFGVKNPDNVVLTHSGSQAVELALRTFLNPGDHVIVSVTEQDRTWSILEEMADSCGMELSALGVNAYGILQYDSIEAMVKPNTKAIVCAHGCGVTGNIADMEKLTAIARRHKLLVISDGCQTAGATAVNMENLGIDVYCFTAHKKIMGPHGIGGLCIRETAAEQFRAALPQAVEKYPQLAEALEPVDPVKLGGFCAAVDFIFEKGIYGISIFPHRLAKRFFESVKSMDAVEVYGDFGTNTRIPTVSISVKGFTPRQVRDHMTKKYGIVVKEGLHDASRMHEALGTAENGLTRFSFGYFNTRTDVNDTVWALMDLLGLEDLYLLA